MLRFIRSVINSIIIVIVVGLAAAFLLPQAFGYQPYMVVSASMQQTFPVGSLIFVKDIAPEDVKVGDPVTFKSGTLTITHRVISINRSARVFTTKGDNNNASEQIPFDSVKGKALDFCIPYLGYFSAWFITATGRITTLMILLAMAVLSFTLSRLSALEEEDSAGETPPAAPSAAEAAVPVEAAESTNETKELTAPAEAAEEPEIDYSEVLSELNQILNGEKKEGESS